MAWFKKTRKPIKADTKASRVPEGLWVKCPSCSRAIFNKELVDSLQVCQKCGYHFRMTAAERLNMLFDNARWTELDAGLRSTDPLTFTDTKPYKSRLEASIKSTGLNDAVIVATGQLDGMPTVIASMEYGFIGGSMGVVVGEKITRAAELALSTAVPLIVVSCSGGARMMEGALSLMQMAKISAALGRLDRARLPYVAILTDPTTGGVTASFAMLGDLNIGRAQGAHRLRRTARHRTDHPAEAAGRLSACEFLLEKGFLDAVVDRRELKATVARMLRVMTGRRAGRRLNGSSP